MFFGIISTLMSAFAAGVLSALAICLHDPILSFLSALNIGMCGINVLMLWKRHRPQPQG